MERLHLATSAASGLLGRLDEVAMVELDAERRAHQVLSDELQRGLRHVDAVIRADLGAFGSLFHSAGVAAGNVEKVDELGDGHQRVVKDLVNLPVQQEATVDDLLVRRL